MRVVYVVGDGPLQGATYAMDGRLPINEDLELSLTEGHTAVYRVGQGAKLWFICMVPPAS
jgi:hypothetical protein